MTVVDHMDETRFEARTSPDDVIVRLATAGLVVSSGLAVHALTHPPVLRRATWVPGRRNQCRYSAWEPGSRETILSIRQSQNSRHQGGQHALSRRHIGTWRIDVR